MKLLLANMTAKYDAHFDEILENATPNLSHCCIKSPRTCKKKTYQKSVKKNIY